MKGAEVNDDDEIESVLAESLIKLAEGCIDNSIELIANGIAEHPQTVYQTIYNVGFETCSTMNSNFQENLGSSKRRLTGPKRSSTELIMENERTLDVDDSHTEPIMENERTRCRRFSHRTTRYSPGNPEIIFQDFPGVGGEPVLEQLT